jgi:hypothetical protein
MSGHYHLVVVWDWEYDREFLAVLETAIHECGLKIYSVSHHNTEETLHAVQAGALRFSCCLDRASDTDERFQPLTRLLLKRGTRFINSPAAVRHASDKATMHLEFLTRGIEVPYTIIISPYNKRREIELSLSELAHLGRPFIIKPANTTGGGAGVIMGAETLKDVIESRQHHKNDKYLLQEEIHPVVLDGKPGWFRVFNVDGLVWACWWDPVTHVYTPLTGPVMARHRLVPLAGIARAIREVCHLDFFSTEIALSQHGKLVVVDYVNEVCDMRLQGVHPDGVPRAMVKGISRRIAWVVNRSEPDARLDIAPQV